MILGLYASPSIITGTPRYLEAARRRWKRIRLGLYPRHSEGIPEGSNPPSELDCYKLKNSHLLLGRGIEDLGKGSPLDLDEAPE